MSTHTVEVHVEDRSPEVLAALENAVRRAAYAMGEQAATYAADNLTRQGAVDTGHLRDSIDYMVKEGD